MALLGLAALVIPAALADPVFVEVGSPVDLGTDGRHGRPFVGADDAWYLGHGRSGRFHVVRLDEDLVPAPKTARVLVDGDGRFVDHALARCPDGSFLHAASGNVERPNDSAWVTPINADLIAGTTRLVVDRDPDMQTNDMALLCDASLQAVAFASEGDWELEIPQRNWLYPVDEALLAGEAPRRLPLHESPRLNGTSLVWDGPADQLAVIAMPGGGSLRANFYDRDLQWSGVLNQQVLLDEGQQVYWSAGALQVGSSFLIVHMVRSMADGFSQDQGNVAITAADADLFLQETVVLTDFEAPEGGMRPALALRGDELLVVWDHRGRFEGARLRVDLEALMALGGPRPQDDAPPEDAVPTAYAAADSGVPAASAPPAPAPTGCAQAGVRPAALGLAAGLGLLLGWRRRP